MRHSKSTSREIARAALLLALFASGCAGAGTQSSEDDGDAADDSFLTGSDVKADVAGIEDGSASACAVLKLASTATLPALDHDAALNSRAAKAIYKVRIGLDGLPDTGDDMWFDSLAALDEVKYVGPKAFKQLLAHTAATGFACG